MESDNNKLTLEQVLHRMNERKKALEEKKVHRKIEKENISAQSENSSVFLESFQQMKDCLQNKISESQTTESENLKNYLDSLFSDLQIMQSALNESSMFLASFQIKTAQQQIDELGERIQVCNATLQPKKKFGFKSKRENANKPKTVDIIDSIDSTCKSSAIDEILERNIFGFRDQTDQMLTKTAEELENRQLNLQNLSDCKIIALGNPSTLQASSLNKCLVILGPLSRSAFIKNCQNCTFVMACQQLRIHDSVDSNFYLHVTGAAIIENCRKVAFAPYNLQYPDLELHYGLSKLDKSVNRWSQIDDFRWLNENEKSPNFTLIDESERNENWL